MTAKVGKSRFTAKFLSQNLCILTNHPYLCGAQHNYYNECRRSLHEDAGIFYACTYDIEVLLYPRGKL